ncbi:hypothetical protein RF55_20827 [Lasius niger]|uniref:Uncharacterized protein n=1 Tax=Lasius niger TaxID=67767 RepID=A0A0J7JZ39_LASNI|nr:hypothetical protein RF55_20827 [Lasius niger]
MTADRQCKNLGIFAYKDRSILTCRELSLLAAVEGRTGYITSTVTTAAHIIGPSAARRHRGIASTTQDQSRTPHEVEPSALDVGTPRLTTTEADTAPAESLGDVGRPRETWEVSRLLSPLLALPTRSDTRATQTAQPARVHRGTQATTSTPRVDQATQSDSDWEPTTRTSATQTEDAADPAIREASPSYTPPGTPPALRRARSAPIKPQRRPRPSRTSRWGLVKFTRAEPVIAYRERQRP